MTKARPSTASIPTPTRLNRAILPFICVAPKRELRESPTKYEFKNALPLPDTRSAVTEVVLAQIEKRGDALFENL
jgi:hypothetical protein